MRRITQWAGAPWLALGLALGALLAPAAAVAAVGLVGIVGSNGKRAQVTAANQLQTAPAPPGQFRSTWRTGVGTTCVPVYTVPATKGFVLTQAVFNVYQNTTPGLANWVGLFRDSGCTFSTAQTIVTNNAPGIGVTVVPFTPGFAVKSGAAVYAKTIGGIQAEVALTGYLVPKAAVPATTPSARVVARPAQGANAG